MKSLIYIDDELELPNFVSRVAVIRDECGFQVHCMDARAGLEAIRKSERKFDGVLLDLIMESDGLYEEEKSDYGLDTGLRVLEDIRKVAPSIPVVVITIRRDKDVMPQLARYGVADVIIKPIELTTLVERIRVAFS